MVELTCWLGCRHDHTVAIGDGATIGSWPDAGVSVVCSVSSRTTTARRTAPATLSQPLVGRIIVRTAKADSLRRALEPATRHARPVGPMTHALGSGSTSLDLDQGANQ